MKLIHGFPLGGRLSRIFVFACGENSTLFFICYLLSIIYKKQRSAVQSAVFYLPSLALKSRYPNFTNSRT